MNFRILRYDTLSSTNLEAKRLIEEGAIDEPTVIVARQQDGGKGSRGRQWISPPGNLYATFVFDFNMDRAFLGKTVYPISIAIADAVSHFVNPNLVKIKWPNDILIEGKKVSGALHETTAHNGKVIFIAGIGINIATFPEGPLNFQACCIRDYAPTIPTSEEVLEELSQRISSHLEDWKPDEFNSVIANYLNRAFRLNEPIEVSMLGDRSDSIRGIFKTIDQQGRLVLEADEKTHCLSTGTIFPDLV